MLFLHGVKQKAALSGISYAVPFCLFVVTTLNRAGLLRGLSETTSNNILFMAQGPGQQNDGLSHSVFFSQSVFKETNRSGTEK